MKIYALLLLVLSFNSQAELTRIFDGFNASCQSKYDVFNSKRTKVIRVHSPAISIENENLKVNLNVNFYNCVNKDGKFKFTNRTNIVDGSYTVPTLEGKQTVFIHEKNHSLIASDDFTKIMDTAQIVRFKDRFSSELNIPLDQLVVNEFENAQDKGSHYIDIRMKSLRAYYLKGESEDKEYDYIHSGAYRLFIDLENQKARF